VPRARRAHPTAAHYAAPVAFLLAVTIAVFLIRAGLHSDNGSSRTERGPVTHPATTTRSTRSGTTAPARRFYIVQSGDTFGSIAAKTGVSVSQLEQLNPGISSNSLRVGQRIRVK
jgi:hypothetical protein